MFHCVECDRSYREFRYRCDCGGVLLYDFEGRRWNPKGRGVWRYQSMIPVERSISLGEGGTPMPRRRDVDQEVYMKLEGDNPTASFKDRGTSVVISDALNRGFEWATVASTGNMGASVSAYCAYANLEARVFVPQDVTEEKLMQMKAYGAVLVRRPGGFSEVVEASEEASEEGGYLASTGVNPFFVEGLKTVAFEIFEEIGVPDMVVVPTGTGGLITAIHKGFSELISLGVTEKAPRMVAVQASAYSPIVDAWESGGEIEAPEGGDTIASAIKVKVPFNGRSAIEAIESSGGQAVTVTDDQIKSAIRKLGEEGVFAEPASAAAMAALEELPYDERKRIVLVITGSGLKDPDALR
ncbi:MAG: threonine synthase [Methanomassiliicoccales archaeon]